jgi:hypothetical protein
MDISFIKKLIQKKSKDFPSDELWIRNDLSFVSFKKNNDSISITKGSVEGGSVFHSTSTDYENNLEYYLDLFRNQNYECFAICL